MSADNLTPTKKAVLRMWEQVRDMIISPECDDETIIVNANKINILNKDVFRESDYMTYDDAIREIGMGYNRNKLSELAKKCNVKSRKFKNSPAGFHRDDIEKIKLYILEHNGEK